MKNPIISLALATVVLILFSCEGTYVVTTRPSPPGYVRPVSPGVGYIWIEGDWFYQGGRYIWHQGYWHRSRGNRRWEQGSWESRNSGWYWKRGHWH